MELFSGARRSDIGATRHNDLNHEISDPFDPFSEDLESHEVTNERGTRRRTASQNNETRNTVDEEGKDGR